MHDACNGRSESNPPANDNICVHGSIQWKDDMNKSAKLDMSRVFSKGHMPDEVLDEALIRWNGTCDDPVLRKKIIDSMKEQVVARFQYDYKAQFNIETGDIVFNVGNDDDFDDSNEKSNLWSLELRKGKSGGLKPDKHGDDIDSIARKCERLCREYVWTALSYSAAGVADA